MAAADTNPAEDAPNRSPEDWTQVRGHHSLLLALEPRFMFDAAVADTVADIADQHHDAAAEVYGDGDGDAGGDTDGDDTNAGADADDDPLAGLGLQQMASAGGIGPQAAGDVDFDFQPEDTVFPELNDQDERVHWDVGQGVTIKKGPNDQITVVITLTDPGSGLLTIDPANYSEHNALVTVEGDVADGCVTFTITGLTKNVNKALEGLQFDGAENWSGTGGIQFTLDGDTHTLDFTIKPVNHKPEITIPDDVKIPEDTWGTISKNGELAINDVDAGRGDGLNVVVIADHDRALRIKDGNGDWVVLSGTLNSDGKYEYTFTGTTQDEINAILGDMQYRGAEDQFGNDTITIRYQDTEMSQNNEWLSEDIEIKVTGVNDNPAFDPNVAAQPGHLEAETEEGGTVYLTEGMFGIYDVEQNSDELFITILEVPEHGTLEIWNGTSWVAIQAGMRFTYDHFTRPGPDGAGTSCVRYTHGGGQVRSDAPGNPDFHDLDGFKFNVNDGAGGFLRDPKLGPDGQQMRDDDGRLMYETTIREVEFSISLTPVNQAPEITVNPSTDPTGDPANDTEGYYTESKPTGEVNPDGSQKYDVSISVFEDEQGAVIKFDVTDQDQIGSYKVYITELPDELDGYLVYNGQKITQADLDAAIAAGKPGFEIDYALMRAGKLTFNHSGKDGWTGSGFQEPGVENNHMGMVRDTAFKVAVVDDGGGNGESAAARTDATINITVHRNNDMPEYINGLVEKDGKYYHQNDDKTGESYVNGTGGNWIIQLGSDDDKGGFKVTDDDSRANEITYVIENTLKNGSLYVRLADGSFKKLSQGDSFTQQQINAGEIVYIFSSGGDATKITDRESYPWWTNGDPEFVQETNPDGTPKFDGNGDPVYVQLDTPKPLLDEHHNPVLDGNGDPVMTNYEQKYHAPTGHYEGSDTLKVTVRDGSYTAWAQEPDGGPVHREGVEAGVGEWVGGEFKFTEVHVDFDLKINFGEPGSTIKPGADLGIGGGLGEVPTAYEGQGVPLAGDGYSALDIYYINAGTNNPMLDDQGNPIATGNIKCRIIDPPANGKLIYNDGTNPPRELNPLEDFFYDDLKFIYYEHDGSETFTDSFDLSITDGSLYLGGGDSGKVTVNINVAPANDTPEVTANDLEVLEGPEAGNSAQDNDDTFDHNGVVILPEHLEILDQDSDFQITEDMYLKVNGQKVPDGNGGYYTNVLKVGHDNKIVLDGNGDPVYFTEAELKSYHSSDTDTTFVIYEPPEYGEIWVYVGPGSPDNAAIDADNGGKLDGNWVKLGPEHFANGETLDDIYNMDLAAWLAMGQRLSAGTPGVGTGVVIFSANDLASGRIRYVHNGADTRDNNGKGQNDTLKFVVNDGKDIPKGGEGPHQQSIATVVEMNIVVKDVNDAPKEIINNPVKTPEGGTFHPGSCHPGDEPSRPHVSDPDYGTVITNNDLQFWDAEQSNNNLKYEVTKPPEQGTIYLNKGGSGTWVALEVGSTFTQADIDNGYVKYVHNGTEKHGIGTSTVDTMNWTLRDGDVNPDKWVHGTLSLEILPANDPPKVNINTGTPGGKFKEKDGYVYIDDTHKKPNDKYPGYDEYVKDLGGLFQVQDPDYNNADKDANGDYKGVAVDEMEVTLTSKYTRNGSNLSDNGTFWYDESALPDLSQIGVQLFKADGTPVTSFSDVESLNELVIKGTRDGINTFLNHLLFYSTPDDKTTTPTDNEADLNAILTITMQVDDLANGASLDDPHRADHNLTATGKVDIWVSTENDSPEWVNGDPDGTVLRTDEDTKIRITDQGGNTIVITDPDAFNRRDNELVITITQGQGYLMDQNGRPYPQTGGVYKFTGTLAQMNDILANLYFVPGKDWNGDAQINITYTDSVPEYTSGPGSAQVPITIVADINIEVMPVNDAPTLVIPDADDIRFIAGGHDDTPNGDWYDIGISPSDPSKGISVGDIDLEAQVGTGGVAYQGDDVLEVDVSAREYGDNGPGGLQGKLRIDGITGDQAWIAGAQLGVVMNPDGTLTLKGTRDQINAALKNLQYCVGVMASDPGDTGTDNQRIIVTVEVDDLGNGENPNNNALQVDGSFFIMVGDINDKPLIKGNPNMPVKTDDNNTPVLDPQGRPVYQVTVREDDSNGLVFNNDNKIYIHDPDALDGRLTVTLTVKNGQITAQDGHDLGLSGWNAGKEYVDISPDGTKITIHATQSHINSILESLTYTSNPDFNGTDTLTVASNDHGNTSKDPTDVQRDERVIEIRVTPVNDAPEYETGSDKQVHLTVNEDDTNSGGMKVGDMFTTTGAHTTAGKPALYDDDRDAQHNAATNPDGTRADGFAGIVIVENGANQTTQGRWQYSTDGGMNWITIGGISKNGPGLYLSADTALRFVPAADYNGTPPALSVHMVDASGADANGDAGGTTYTTGAAVSLYTGGVLNTAVVTQGSQFSKDAATINIVVKPINDAPEVATGKETVDYQPPSTPMSNKADDVANPGKTVESLFKPSFDDSTDTVAGGSTANGMSGVVVVGQTDHAGKGTWQYQDGGVWKDIPATTGNEGFYLDKGALIRFDPDPDYVGDSPELTVKLVDNSTANGSGPGGPGSNYNPAAPTHGTKVDLTHVGDETRYSADNVTLKTYIADGNNAPEIITGKETVVETVQEDRPPAQGGAKTVEDLFKPSFSNADKTGDTTTGFAGVVVVDTAPDADKGAWEYWNGSAWVQIDASGGKGVYLSAGTQVRFNPAGDYNGPAPSLKAHLAEQTPDGNAPHTNGTVLAGFNAATRYDNNHESLYTAGTVTVTMTVTSVNDAPELATGSDGKVGIEVNEDDANPSGVTVGDLFTTDTHTATGKPAPYDDSRDAQRDGGNPAGSTADNFAGIVVVANGADPATQGEWWYKAPSGSWTKIDPMTLGQNGLFLAADVQLRFVPAQHYNGTPPSLTVHMVDASGADATGAYGQTGGYATGDDVALYRPDGALNTAVVTQNSEFSTGTVEVGVTVKPVNDAPTVEPGEEDQDFGDVKNKVANQENSGETVGTVFGPAFNDDTDTVTGGSSSDSMLGVVVIGNDSDAGRGRWQYETSPGVWADIPTTGELGGKGFFLESDTKIRFAPNKTFISDSSNPAPTLTVRLVDDSDANGTPGGAGSNYNPAEPTNGTKVDLTHVGNETRYSQDTVNLSVTVTGGNTAPFANDPPGDLALVTNEDTHPDAADCPTIKDIFVSSPNPIFNNGEDGVDGFAGVVIVDCPEAPGKGVWQYWDPTRNSGAGDWVDIDITQGVDNPLFLGPDTAVRFSPAQDYNGPAPSMTVHLAENDIHGNCPVPGVNPGDVAKTISNWNTVKDDHIVGNDPYFSANSVEVTMTVRPVNDAPVIGGIADTTGSEQSPITIAPNGTLGDVDLDGFNANQGNWGGATLTVGRSDGAGNAAPSADDVFSFDTGVTVTGNTLRVGGTVVGTYTSHGGVLSITFSDNAASADVETVLRNITYTYNRDDVPGGVSGSGDIHLLYTVNDKNAGSDTTMGNQGFGAALQHSVEQKITINNTPDPAVGVNDRESIALPQGGGGGQWTADGNVLHNDGHRDYPSTFWDSNDRSSVLEVTSVTVTNPDGSTTHYSIPPGGSTVVQGQYGSLTIHSDGSYVYELDTAKPGVQTIIQQGGSVNESFSYTVQKQGNSDPSLTGGADLVIDVTAPAPDQHVEMPPEVKEPEVGRGEDDPAGPDIPGDNDKPVAVTVEDFAHNGNNVINNNLDGFRDHLHERPLPPSPGLERLYDLGRSLEFPTLIGNTDEKQAAIEERNEFSLPDDLFIHSKRGEFLSYTALLPDGSPLPDWMEFDPDTFTIICTPPAEARGAMQVVVRAEDRRGLKADATVTIKIGDPEETRQYDLDGNVVETEPDAEAAEAEPDAEAEAGEEPAGEAEPTTAVHPGLRHQLIAAGSGGVAEAGREVVAALLN